MLHKVSVVGWLRSSIVGSLVLCVAMLAGCGGGGSGGGAPPASSSTPPPSAPVTPPPAVPEPPTPPAPTVIAPSIRFQPSSQRILQGSSILLNVLVSGTEPMSYQWKRNGVVVAGANDALYTIPAAVYGTHNGLYSVVVSNPAGQVESTAADVVVLFPPALSNELTPQQAVVGDRLLFAISATGPDLTYLWRRNGVALSGVTGNTYEIASAKTTDAGTIEVVVTNPFGTASAMTTLTVREVPPTHVDAAPMSFLSALGALSESAGEQHVADADGSATITLTRAATFIGELPSSYVARLATTIAPAPQWLDSLELPARDVTLNRRVQGNIAGVDLERYDGLETLPPGFSRVGMNVFFGIRSGFKHVGVGNWKYIGDEQRGYWAGYRTGRSSFVIGKPSATAVMPTLTTGTYSGFSQGALEYELLSLRSAEEFSATAAATYNSTTQRLVLTLSGFKTYDGYLGTNGVGSAWPTADPDNETILSSISMSCEATIDTTTNAFTCPLTDSNASLTGTFQGKFYGETGSELAGTFSIVGLIRYSFDDGIVGSVALKR